MRYYEKINSIFFSNNFSFTNIGIVRASEITDNIPDLILSDIEIKEFNTYLNQLKNNKDELNGNSIQSRSVALTGPSGFLVGSFSIPGVGPVVITIGGAIIVAGVTVKALQDGSEKSEGRNIFVRTLVYKGKTIQVRFIKDANGLIKALSTAWVK